MGIEGASKAYRVYDLKTYQFVMTSDVAFDKSTFGFLPTPSQKLADETGMDSYLIRFSINESCTLQSKQTGSGKSRAEKILDGLLHLIVGSV